MIERRRFSRNHSFSRDEVAGAVTTVAGERRGRRLFLNVTMGHRRLAMRQVTVSSTVGALTMLSLYLSELSVPTLDQSAFQVWTLATIANIAARAGLNYWVFANQPTEMAGSVARRLVPLVVIVLNAVQWLWCIFLFVGAGLNTQVLVLFAGLLGVSVAVMGMWPTTPVGAVIYLVTSWPPFFFRLYQAQWMPLHDVVAVAVSVGLVLWACVFLEVNQVRSILDRSDQADLLMARLQEMNAELKVANSTLDVMRQTSKDELESRSMFFSAASHDFRQRLHAMKLLSHAAIQEAGDSRRRVNGPLSRLSEAVEDVERYISELLDFARTEGGGLTPTLSTIELQTLFQQLDLNFEDVAAAEKVRLHVRPTELVLRTDAGMIQRVLENLLSNAIKFSSGRRVLLSARRRGGTVAIEVWDQGPGILPEAQAAIFAPFYQSDVDHRHAGGVGLGLAVVKRFVDCLGYEINVRSRMGRGTVMTVLVPQSAVSESV